MGTRGDLIISSLLSSMLILVRSLIHHARFNAGVGSVFDDEYKVIYSRTDGDSIHSIRTTLSAEYHKSKSVHQIASLLFAIWFPFDKRELLGRKAI